MRTVTHTEHQKDYDAGFQDKLDEIRGMGIDAAMGKFGMDYPVGCKASTLGAWYYMDGQSDAIYQFNNGMVK